MVRARCATLPDSPAADRWRHHPLTGLVLAGLIVALDQWSKAWAVEALPFRTPQLVTSWFDLTLTFNTGAAFSFLADAGGWQRGFLTGVSLLVSVFIAVWLFRLPPAERAMVWPLGLILGGGLGNLVDRWQLGHVVDFISLHYLDWYWPAFNVADSAITLGAVWWLGGLLFWGTRDPTLGAEERS